MKQSPGNAYDDRPIKPQKQQFENQLREDLSNSPSKKLDSKKMTQFLKRKKVYDPKEAIK